MIRILKQFAHVLQLYSEIGIVVLQYCGSDISACLDFCEFVIMVLFTKSRIPELSIFSDR